MALAARQVSDVPVRSSGYRSVGCRWQVPHIAPFYKDARLITADQGLKVHPGQEAVAVNLLDCGATLSLVAANRQVDTPSVKSCPSVLRDPGA
jgi:hypothetical protein